MILLWKKKGIFVVLYLFIFFFLTIYISDFLAKTIGGIFASNYDNMWWCAITSILSGAATILTDVYTIEKGKLVKDEYQLNSFLLIPMKLFGQLLIGFGLLNILVIFFD